MVDWFSISAISSRTQIFSTFLISLLSVWLVLYALDLHGGNMTMHFQGSHADTKCRKGGHSSAVCLLETWRTLSQKPLLWLNLKSYPELCHRPISKPVTSKRNGLISAALFNLYLTSSNKGTAAPKAQQSWKTIKFLLTRNKKNTWT